MSVILVENLFIGDNCYDYADQVDLLVQRTIAEVCGLRVGEASSGYNALFDIELNDTKIEVKFTTIEKNIRIEFASEDDSPSGISLTEAELYCFISPGYSLNKSTGKYIKVGKVRLFKTVELKQKVRYCIDFDQSLIKSTPGNEYGAGYSYIEISNAVIKDGVKNNLSNICLFDLPIITEGSRIIGYRFANIRTYTKYINKVMHKWIPYIMNIEKWIDDSTIFSYLAGSHSYGLNTPESDEDVRGVCLHLSK